MFLPLLYAFCFLTVAFSIGMFFTTKLLRSVILLALVVVSSAILFDIMGQEIIAVLQLLIFVGGLSTYFIVAFGAGQETRKQSPRLATGLIVAFALIGVSMVYYVLKYYPAGYAHQNTVISFLAQAFNAYYAYLYLLVFMLFASAVGSVLVIRRFAKIKRVFT
ncbi:MAG: hypothetical protein ACP5T4_02320 [Candidatus Micrarchaeia archaeon]